MTVETDILVCGPTPVEHQQVRAFLAVDGKGSGEKENEFTFSRPDNEKRPARVACVTLGDMGPDAVDAPLNHFLNVYRPKLVLLTGIAGVSLRSNLTVGDVVIASDISNHMIVHYGSTGAKADTRSVPIVAQTRSLLASLSSVERQFLKSIRRRLEVASIRPPQLKATEVNPDFKYLEDLKTYRQEVDRRFERASRGDRRFKAAKFASSGAFHKNPNIAHEVTQGDIDRDCFEMESVRVMNVCFEKHVPAIMIKAISDIVGFKTKQSSSYARNVAGATIATLLFESREFWRWFDDLVMSAPRPIPIDERETIPLQPLVGRRDALQRILALAAAGNNVVISGPPGIGKTRLLEEIRGARRPNAFVRLEQGGHAVRDIRLALHRFSRAPFPLDDDEGIDLVRRNLITDLVLLVDNADSEESAQAVCRIAGHLLAVRVIATSRAASFPGFVQVALPPLTEAEAVELLNLLGERERERGETLAEVVRQGNGNPLLLQQAAWAIDSGEGKAPGSDRVAAIVREMGRKAPALVALLRDFPASVHPLAVVAACGADGDLFELLRRNAVVQSDGSLLRFHEILRSGIRRAAAAFAAFDPEGVDGVATRYAAWLANASFDEIDQVLPNVLYLVRASGLTGIVAIADSLVDDNLDDPSGYIPARGVGVLFLEHGGHIEQSAAEIRGPVGARVLKYLGIFAQRVDDPRAESLLLAARSLYRSIDDLEGAAAATWMLGAIADDASRYGDAEFLYREPLTWLREPRSLAVSHHLVGCTLYHQGRLSEARAAFTRARQLAPDQDMELESRLLRREAYLTLTEGQYVQAVEELVDARASAETLGKTRNVARISKHLALAHTALGNYAEAQEYIKEAEGIFDRAQDKRGLGGTLRAKGKLLRLIGDIDDARTALVQSCNLALGPAHQDISRPPRSVYGYAAGQAELWRLERSLGKRLLSGEHFRASANAFEAINHPALGNLLRESDVERDRPIPATAGIVFDLIDTLALRDSSVWDAAETEMAQTLDVDQQSLHVAWRNSRARASIEVDWSPEDRVKSVAAELGREPDSRTIRALGDRQRSLWVESLRLRTDAEETLGRLRAAGVSLAVISNGSSSMVGAAEKLGLDKFASTLLSCEVGAVKPHAMLYRAALERLELKANSVLYVGNGDDYELEGARVLGIFAVKMRMARPSFYRVGQSYSWDAGVASLPELLSRGR